MRAHVCAMEADGTGVGRAGVGHAGVVVEGGEDVESGADVLLRRVHRHADRVDVEDLEHATVPVVVED
jgi:hypothetical protein